MQASIDRFYEVKDEVQKLITSSPSLKYVARFEKTAHNRDLDYRNVVKVFRVP